MRLYSIYTLPALTMAYIIIIYTHIHSINIYLLDILPAVLLLLYTFERQLNKKEKKSYSEHTHTLFALFSTSAPPLDI